MPHTDTNISRDALRSYGMQPTRRPDEERSQQSPGGGRPIRIYGDGEEINPEFTREGFLRPCRITWEDGRKYMIDRVKRCERRASRKAGGMGLMYTCMVAGQEVNLFYEENQRWFVTRK